MEHISEYNNVKYVHFDLLDETGLVSHGFSTRVGGISTGVYDSLNIGYNRGDRDEAVAENLKRIAACFGFTPERMVKSVQTHTANIQRITAEDAGTGVVSEARYMDVDGLITNEPGLLLYTVHADCTPVFLLDPVQKAAGIVHSGWMGTAERICEAAITSMEEEFGTDPADLKACIGPCICGKCYEVGMDVAIEFVGAFSGYTAAGRFADEMEQRDVMETDEVFTAEDPILKPLGNEKFLLDMKAANRRMLLECGLKSENISISDLCTYEREDLFFSHRRMGTNRGTMGAFIALR